MLPAFLLRLVESYCRESTPNCLPVCPLLQLQMAKLRLRQKNPKTYTAYPLLAALLPGMAFSLFLFLPLVLIIRIQEME